MVQVKFPTYEPVTFRVPNQSPYIALKEPVSLIHETIILIGALNIYAYNAGVGQPESINAKPYS